MAKYSGGVDAVFVALANPTRRSIVARLGSGSASVSSLAEGYPMTLPSFMKQLRALEESGLVRTSKSGRVRRCELDRDRLAVVDGWLAEQRLLWEGRSDRLEAFLRDEPADTEEIR